MSDWLSKQPNESDKARREPLIALHAMAVSRFPIPGQACETCDTPLRYLVVGYSSRGRASGMERLEYCTMCDDVKASSGPWASEASS